MDVVRAYFRAVNAADLDALTNLYNPDCIVEEAGTPAAATERGRDRVRVAWATEFREREGALEGGHRYEVTRIAGIETGWGWVRAEWSRIIRARPAGPLEGAVGYTHFWIEDGLIRRQRSIAHVAEVSRVRDPRPASERRYPTRPLVGIGAVVFSADGRVLLVKRKHEPLAGQWSLPGGMLELGESLEAGVEREILEETGLVVTVGDVVEVFDRILLDDEAKVRYHFVLIDYICRVRGGTLRAGSDVEAAEFVRPEDVDRYVATEKARDVIRKAIRLQA
jgi:ADP-ribose pyrophosphatase YjhB (NUDIX family)